MRDTWAPGAFPATPSLIDVLQQGGRAYHVSDWRVPDEAKIAKAREVIAAGETPVVVLYLTGVDSTQHRHGVDRKTEWPQFISAGKWAEKLRRRLGGDAITSS